jgi:hypothetical protein
MRPISFWIALLVVAFHTPVAAEHQTLFVGNSYSFANGEMLAEGFEALLAETSDNGAVVKMVAKGGYTLDGHLKDANQEGQQIHEFLSTEGATWNFVVLQEQSVIPAYHEAVAWGWYDSLAAADGLNKLIEKSGGATVFLMTWGRREGLAEDAEMLPDYLTMQGLLAGGYEKYADYTSTPERPVLVAPAGLAWKLIWEDAVAAGNDPLDPDGLFWRLYTGDGSHPSVLGSYLATLVVFATATGSDPRETKWLPDGVTAEEAQTLRNAAFEVVLGEPVTPPVEVVEAVEPMELDVSMQPEDTQTKPELVAAPDLPAMETAAQDDSPEATPETTTELPGVTAPVDEQPATSKKSGCGTANEPTETAVALLIALMLGIIGVRLRVWG